MSAATKPVAIGPSAYVAWRETSLGAVTERLELTAMLDLMGDLKGVRVLDVGCGDGLLACRAAARGAFVTGVDADAAMLEAARARAEEEVVHVTFLETRAESLPFASGAFDLACAVTVLCFIEDVDGALAEMARVLRPGGAVVIGELGHWSLWAAARRLRGWLGSATWRRARFRDAVELRRLAERAGLRVITMRGVVFHPPVALLARAMAPFDPWLGRRTTFGAAFIALRGVANADFWSH
jgi:2-polyprenyl-3-methyl-5-hydroxy-6-metoxy-1,4-benzoquinol methylase